MKGLLSFRDILNKFPALGTLGSALSFRSIPYVQQLTATECGVACLAMVLRYYGKDVALEELRDVAVSGRDATNAQKLIDTARLYGLRGRAVTFELDQLHYLDRPSILHWEFNHFVVFDRLSRQGVQIVDPKFGRRRVSQDQFQRSFTGVALFFEPESVFERGSRSKTPMIHFLRAILSERGFLPHIVLTSLLLQSFGLALPLLTRLVIDEVIPNQDYHLLVVLGVGVLFLTVFQSAAAIVRGYLLLFLRTRLDARLTLGFFDHLLALPFDFFQRRSSGDLLMRMSSNATVREILTGSVLSALLDGSLAVAYLLLLFAISPPMALLAFGLASVQLGFFLFTRHRQRDLIASTISSQARSQSYLVETLSAVETLKALGAEQRAAERWSGLFSRDLNLALKRGRLDAAVEAVGSAIRTGSSMALLGLGTIQVMDGTLTLGDMMAVTAVAGGFLGPLTNLVSEGTRLQLLATYLERLNDVFQTPTERDRTESQPFGRLSGAVSVEDVCFRYGPISPLVVRNVSTRIQAGEFVAIVGRSGSGKSTLARLLVGLYAPTEGCVSYDGIDLLRLDVVALRRQIGVVTQQAQLFGGTIRSNIALSDPAASLDTVIQSAKIAQIHADIMAMPMGYDTVLIDRGASLSGGEQQRVALARALLPQPRILVLDEATSQLDATTERAVQDQLARLPWTRIVIAHRLSTIMAAHRILVMQDGRIVEEGTHDELIARRGAYTELVAAQMTTDGTTSGWQH